MGCCQSRDVDSNAHSGRLPRNVAHYRPIRKRDYARIRRRDSEASRDSSVAKSNRNTPRPVKAEPPYPVDPAPLSGSTAVLPVVNLTTTICNVHDERPATRKRTGSPNSPPKKRPARQPRGSTTGESQMTVYKIALVQEQLHDIATSNDDTGSAEPNDRSRTLSDDIAEILTQELDDWVSPTNEVASQAHIGLEAQVIASRSSLDELLTSLDSPHERYSQGKLEAVQLTLVEPPAV